MALLDQLTFRTRFNQLTSTEVLAGNAVEGVHHVLNSLTKRLQGVTPQVCTLDHYVPPRSYPSAASGDVDVVCLFAFLPYCGLLVSGGSERVAKCCIIMLPGRRIG